MAYACPRCGMNSHNASDDRYGYCGNCKAFTRDREHRPVPVAAARDIGWSYLKSVVVVVAYDPVSGRSDVITWGRDARDKAFAAKAGDRVAYCFGLADPQAHEDFRTEDRGKLMERIDALEAEVRRLKRDG